MGSSFLTRRSSVRLFTAAGVIATAAAAARAELIAYEPFLTGSNRANNEYGPPTGTAAQDDIRSFAVSGGHGLDNGNWTGSTAGYGINATQYLDPNISYEQGGSLRWGGTSDATGFLRSVQRGLTTYTPSDTYYLSAVVRRGAGASVDDALVGFTNGTIGTSQQGVFFGFEADRGAASGSVSLVLKTGNVNLNPADPDGGGPLTPGPATATVNEVLTKTVTESGTTFDSTFNRVYTVVVKIAASESGAETVTYWVDDDTRNVDWTSDATASGTARYTGSFVVESMSTLGAINTFGFFSPSSSGEAWFDELRFGTTMFDATAVPEPAGFVGVAAVGGLLALRRRPRA
jgi:hypothetical protein